MSGTSKAGLLADLRARIAPYEAPLREEETRVVSLGDVIDETLPSGGLRRDALHEVAALGYGDIGAAMGFMAALVSRFAEASPLAPVLWCEGSHTPFDFGGLYGPGLAAFGLDPARLVVVTPSRDVELLWTLEEALRLGAFAAVVGEIDASARAFDLTATRRLQLAAEEGGSPALLLTGHRNVGTSAAVTRWRIASAPSSAGLRLEGQSAELPGRPRWNVTLERCRGAEGGAAWLAEWDRTRLEIAVPRRKGTEQKKVELKLVG